jgi:hypothetical protein
MYAAAACTGGIAANLSAGHGKGTPRVHAAACGTGSIAADFAAVHGEFRTACNMHSAAAVCGGITAYFAAVHGKCAAAWHVHAAAPAWAYIITQNRAGVHCKFAAVVDSYKHAAAAAGKIAAVVIVVAIAYANQLAVFINFLAAVITVIEFIITAAVNNYVSKNERCPISYSKQVTAYTARNGNGCGRVCATDGKRYAFCAGRGDAYKEIKREILVNDDLGMISRCRISQ